MRVAGGQDLVRTMAVGADCCLRRAFLDGASMHALLIGDEGLRAFAVGLHEELLTVTLAAGDGNVGVSDWRFGIVRATDLVRLAMAVLAGSSGTTGLSQLGMEAMRVGLLRIAVAVGAADSLRWRLMGEALDVFVAVDAGEHAAMEGVLKLVAIDEESNRLAVLLFAQR